jgi:acetyltransferase-like isoleucine patch superfamily enzyme
MPIVTVGNKVSLMTGVVVKVLSIVTVGNNVSLMTGVDVNVLSIVTVKCKITKPLFVVLF